MASLPLTPAYRTHAELAFARNISLQVYVLLYSLMIVLLVTREMPLTAPNIDDEQYMQHFVTGLSEFDFSDPIAFLEEPLWSAYCEVLSIVVSPETGIRVTILLSALILGAVPLILRAEAPIFYALWFAFHPHLAPEITFNQIRQGFGLAVFVGLLVLSRRVVIPAFIGTPIHTSVASLVILAIARRHTLAICAVAALALALHVYTDELGFLLGRRAWYLDEPIELTLNYYIVNAGILLLFAVLLRKHGTPATAQGIWPMLYWGWFYLSICNLVISLYLQFGPRLDYFSAYFLGLLLALGSSAHKEFFYARLFAAMYLLLLVVRLEVADKLNSPIRNWGLILGF